MNEIQQIVHDGQRVLFTYQLAEAFNTDTKIISQNFNRNTSRYVPGKHFYCLSGDEKREFLNLLHIEDGIRNASALYLWTEKGAWLHAKSLNTDQAWEAYEMLVDDYYRVKETSLDLNGLSPQLQLLIQMEQGMKQLENRQQQTEAQISTIRETFMQRDDNWRQKINGMLNGAAMRTGGNFREIRKTSYELLEERAHCNLNIRVTNLKERLAERGETKTKIKDANRLDVIEADPRLKEIYSTIVKELAIGTLA